VKVSDVHGSRTDRAALTVTNVAPSVAGGAASTVAEGTELSGAATYTDPGKADTHRAVTTFGDAGTTGPQDVTGGSAPWKHTWVDEGRFDVTTEVTDDDGGKAAATRSVTVTNAAPVVGVPTAPVTPVQVGTAITASGSFTDAGRNDKHTATWTWGDGSTSPATLTQEAGGGSVKDTHTFTTPGIYTVELTVADEDGGRATNAFEYVVVYDPAGGFTTGGGWITSPAGAYTPDPTATGTANFGFVSKYQKGASVPTGTTSFRFRAGGLDFDSTSYDWLVIAGSRAQYKGKGTVNGQAGYGFLVSGVDGDAGTNKTADTLRVKIWRTSDGSTVYDNQMGAKDDALATTAIGGGQIQVQAPKK
jgi:PKD repeat protein